MRLQGTIQPLNTYRGGFWAVMPSVFFLFILLPPRWVFGEVYEHDVVFYCYWVRCHLCSRPWITSNAIRSRYAWTRTTQLRVTVNSKLNKLGISKLNTVDQSLTSHQHCHTAVGSAPCRSRTTPPRPPTRTPLDPQSSVEPLLEQTLHKNNLHSKLRGLLR